MFEASRPLMAALFAKDPATYHHSVRVACIAPALAMALNCSMSEISAVHLVALLHDIGKIGIPDSILTKAGSLSEDEWTTMKKHSSIGHRIVRRIPCLQARVVAHAVKHLHEHFDGNGYPDGLSGQDIPILSRVTSVADCFDAIHSKRVYKTAFSVKDTIGIMEKEVGTKHDPEIFKSLVLLVS